MSATVNGSLAGLTGSAGAKPYTHAYNVTPEIAEQAPVRFAQKPHAQAAEEVHAYNSSFKNRKEREVVQQLLEEGRIELEGIESGGLPESFGEVIDFITHGGKLPPGITVRRTKSGAPAGISEQGASQKGNEELPKIGGIAGEVGKWILGAILLAAGAVLVVYGIMVAVRPRERAFSIPVPGV